MARTQADALAVAREKHGGNSRFSDVLAISSLLIDGKPVGHHHSELVILDKQATIEVLPPFAGG
jgi:hypothetical protein